MAPPARSVSRADTAVLIGCLSLGFVVRVVPEPMKEPVAATLRRSMVAPLISLQRDAELTRRAWLERDDRTQIRDSAALDAMSLPAVRRENEQLRSALGLGARLRWGFVPAEILRGHGVNEENTVTLSAGERAGIRAFSPVVAVDGLVGMVKTVDPRMSIAILWSHPDFRVSAMAADGSAFGIVAAHLGRPQERHLLELRGVPIRSTLKPGTEVWSSGLGGVFPRGVPLGTVIGEDKRPAEAWARTYLLQPAVNHADVDAVMILQPERTTTGVEGVWASRASVDLALRRIVAAGDSMAQGTRADTAPTRSAPPVRRDTARTRPVPVVRPETARARPAPIPTPPLPAVRHDTLRSDSIQGDTAGRGTALPPP
ncbi:MAG: rod shape-determining protein MreC [Gemmatimonadota bacterium]|nr:rod shape-determining protein MreC [Gemmatimonadota bacterium]